MSTAYYHEGLTIEIDLSVRKATIEGCEVLTEELNRLFDLTNSDSERLIKVRAYCQRYINQSEAFRKRDAARDEHLKILKKGVEVWNKWRQQENPTVRPLFYGCDLREKAIGIKLDGVNFANAVLINAKLQGQSLRKANFHEANLGGAELQGADLTEANFCRTDLYETKMQYATLFKANLQGTQLAKTNFSGAKLIECKVYGISAWDLKLNHRTEQRDLKIRYSQKGDDKNRESSGETELAIDDLQMAQYLYMLLNNENLRTVIDATTSRVVLILGRFTPPERKAVLDKIRDTLRNDQYVPILFDFTPSDNRDLTETIQLLASLAKFVIADLTDAKSIPQELSQIVPYFPSLPIQPILLASQREYAMFEHWRRYPWVLPEFLYETQDHLIEHLMQKVVDPVKTRIEWMSPQDSLTAAKREIESLMQQVEEMRNECHE